MFLKLSLFEGMRCQQVITISLVGDLNHLATLVYSIQNYIIIIKNMTFKWKMTNYKFIAGHAIIIHIVLLCEYQFGV